MSNLVKIELTVLAKDAKNLVGLLADAAVELHVTQVPNIEPTTYKIQRDRNNKTSRAEALRQSKSQPAIKPILELAKSKATFTIDEAKVVTAQAGYASSGATSSISRLVMAGLLRKIAPKTWEFDRAALSKEGLL